MAYSHYRPILKQANVTVGDALAALNPTNSLLKDYAIYAGGGGLAGAGIGALVNALRGESKLKGALIGGGIGAGAGAGLKGIGDYAFSDEKAELARLARQAETEFRWPWKTLAPELAQNLKDEPLMDNLSKNFPDFLAAFRDNPKSTPSTPPMTMLEALAEASKSYHP